MPEPAPEKPIKTDKLQELKQKYRLDAEVKLKSKGSDNKKLGVGPLLDPQVFNKFAALDHTRNKRYLDWMLFQAGGGIAAFKKSKENWGDFSDPLDPVEMFRKFKREKPNNEISYDELSTINQEYREAGTNLNLLQISEQIREASNKEESSQAVAAITGVLKQYHVAAGNEERLAMEIAAYKFKKWLRHQLGTKTQDRVTCLLIFNRHLRGKPLPEAIAEVKQRWPEIKPRQRREYVFGDQDLLKWESFGFQRHWPGRNNVYELTYNTMRQFLANVDMLTKYHERLAIYNERVAEKNKALPPNQQIPLREKIAVSADIGKVLVLENGDLDYKGNYPTIQTLARANEEMTELPVKERVRQDVRYAGPKGVRSNNATLYSDENLDVLVPLTVAAAVRSGHESWDISNASQLGNLKPHETSTWAQHAIGKHGHLEWEGTQAITIFFHIKAGRGAPQRLYMKVFADDLVDLQSPFLGTVWRLAGQDGDERMTYRQVIKTLQTTMDSDNYYKVVRSIGHAMRVIREWGQEFDPKDIVGDFAKHHREAALKKRSFAEDVKTRAIQIVHLLAE